MSTSPEVCLCFSSSFPLCPSAPFGLVLGLPSLPGTLAPALPLPGVLVPLFRAWRTPPLSSSRSVLREADSAHSSRKVAPYHHLLGLPTGSSLWHLALSVRVWFRGLGLPSNLSSKEAGTQEEGVLPGAIGWLDIFVTPAAGELGARHQGCVASMQGSSLTGLRFHQKEAELREVK